MDIIAENAAQATANQGDSRLLAKLSQEIRGPMYNIISQTDQLLGGNLEAGQRDNAMDIKRASNALLALINDVLDYSRIEAGQLELASQWFSMAELMETLSSIFRLMAQNKGLAFEASLDPTLPEVLLGDGYRLRQILNSLLGNALNVTQSGSIRLEAQWDGACVTFRVADSSPEGHSADSQALFDPLVQIDAQKYGGAGSGLSLLISRSLCQLMGGGITIERLEGGSVFTAHIPMTPGTSADLQARLSHPARFTTRNVRALAVDDIEINLFITRQVLENFGVHVITAEGGQEAIEHVEADSFDIIFMDHMMPLMDGIEATKRIRQIEGRQCQTPIIALTANAVVGAREMFLRHGLDDYIAKPIEHEDMAACLLKWLPSDKIVGNKAADNG